MRILQVIPSYSPTWGGPSKLVNDLSKHLAKKGVTIDILTTFKDGEPLYPVYQGVGLIKLKRNSISRLWTGFSLEAVKFLNKNIKRYDLVHIHELWHFPHLISFILAMRAEVPYIVTVHGGLDEWCINYKRFKKQIYSFAVQKNVLRKASKIHVLTSEEKLSVVKYLNNSSGNEVIIPNGLDPSEFKNLPLRGSFRKKYTLLEDKRYILFLGRINIVKGLDILVKAFEELTRAYKDLYLVIVGPDNEGYGEKLKRWLDDANLLERSRFTGILTGEDKFEAFGDAEVFVLPSYSEGFPMAVIEAMACGIPVVISNKVGICGEVECKRAGLVVETNPKSLSEGIKALLDNEELRREVSENGERLVEEYYDIDKVADMMIKAYKEAIDGGDGLH